jgi:ribokinase
MTKQIVVVGSINLDLVASADRVPVAGETISGHTFRTFFGGKGANQAVAVGRLGHPVSMLGKVGDDTFGPQLRKALRDAGVDVNAVGTVKSASGVALIATGSKGENSIIVVPGANGQLLPRDLDKHKALIRSAGMLLTQLETPLETIEYLGRLAQKFEVPLMLDPAPARSLPADLLKSVSWLTPNETETRILLGVSEDVEPARAADELRARGARNVVLKLGDKGAYVATSDGQRAHVLAFPVRAVDTTAAGDAFNGAFAVALMQGKSVQESVRYGCAVAAISVTRAGAQPSMPSRGETQRFLKQQSRGKSAIAS